MQGQGNVGSNYTQFEHEIIQRMKEPPYNCTDACASPEYQTVRFKTESAQIQRICFRLLRMLVSYTIQYTSMEL